MFGTKGAGSLKTGFGSSNSNEKTTTRSFGSFITRILNNTIPRLNKTIPRLNK
jgi:hypothetical protein